MEIERVKEEVAVEQAPLSQTRQIPYTDALRVFGAFAVIVIHVSSDGSAAIGTLNMRSWLICCGFEAISRWAVPIFIMVSGLLLLDPSKNESPGQFYKKRLQRLALPVLAWSSFYLAWRWFYEGERFRFGTALYQFISGSAYYHLWFLTMLVGLYIATPALRVLVKNMSARQLWWVTGTLLALAMGDAIVRANDDTDFTFLFKFCPFIGLYLLGYCLRTVPRTKNMVTYGFLAWIGGAAVSLAASYILCYHCATSQWDADNRLFLMDDEFSPSVLVMTMGFFTMIAAWYESRNITRPSKLVQTLSSASLGIYLAHPLFLSILNSNNIDYEWHGIAVGIPVSVAVAAVGATALSLIIGKVPYVKNIA